MAKVHPHLPAALVKGYQAWKRAGNAGDFQTYFADLKATQAGAAAYAQVHPGATTAQYTASIRALQAAAATAGLSTSQFATQLRELQAGYKVYLQTHPGASFAQFGAALRAQQAGAATSGTPGWLLPAILVGGAGVLGIGVVVATSHPHARSSATGHPAHPPMSGPALRSTAA